MSHLGAIRERHVKLSNQCDDCWAEYPCDAVDLLAHIDALTAKVEALPYKRRGTTEYVDRAAVLAILGGEE